MVEILQFHATIARFNDKRKLIYIPKCITENLEKYQGQRVRVILETIDNDLK